MNRLLLFAAGLSMTVTAMGQSTVSGRSLINERQASAVTSVKAEKIVGGKALQIKDAEGRTMKKIANRTSVSRTINPLKVTKSPAKAGELNGSDILFESFEGWDGETVTWVPDGWTVESFGSPENEYYHKWYPTEPGIYSPDVTDGKYYYGIIFSSNDQDEWLISPEVTMTEPMSLSFDMNVDPLWFYNLDNFDFDTYEFVGEPEVIFDIKVNIRETGGEWTTLLSFADMFKDMSGMDMLLYNQYQQLLPYSISLADYVGKTFQIAFQYVGADGQSYFIDNIRIGYPKLEAPVYLMPYCTQYWGFTREFEGLNIGVAALPVFTDLTWSSYDYFTDIDGATYTWEYNDPADTDNWLTADGDELTTSYGTDYTNEFTTNTNLYYLPKLTLSAPEATAATYQNPAAFMQMGGRPVFTANTENGPKQLEMGLVPFNRAVEDLGTFTYTPDFGEAAIPIFGYNNKVDGFWTDYTFGGQNEEDEGVKLTKIMNFIYSSESAMVVTAADLFALVSGIGENVEFTCGIYPLNDSYEPEFDQPLGTATIKGKDLAILAPGDQSPDLARLTFEFEKPLVLDDTYMAYVVAVSGFNNPDVTYFCPLQSLYAADAAMALGWIEKEITFNGSTRSSYSPMSDEEGNPLYTTFAINLEAYLPWLHTDTDNLEISNNGTITGMDSYYAAEDLTVTAPDWAEVTMTGRYGATELTVKADFTETARSGEITVEAPGVKKVFTLTQAAGTGSSIDSIITDGDTNVESVYDLAGRQVSAEALTSGVYLVKLSSGKVRKVAVK